MAAMARLACSAACSAAMTSICAGASSSKWFTCAIKADGSSPEANYIRSAFARTIIALRAMCVTHDRNRQLATIDVEIYLSPLWPTLDLWSTNRYPPLINGPLSIANCIRIAIGPR